MTELIFVRHGVTSWNKSRRFQGHIDIPLDEEGLEQARRVGRRLAEEAIDAVYASDLQRARQTAEPVAQARGLPLQIDPALRERFYGVFEGKTPTEMEAQHAEDFQRWRQREPGFVLPGGGESLESFNARVVSMMRALVERHPGQRVVAVTHGGVLDCIYRAGSGMPLHEPRRFDILNASINRIGWDGSRFRLLAWADVAHLDDALDDVEARAD